MQIRNSSTLDLVGLSIDTGAGLISGTCTKPSSVMETEFSLDVEETVLFATDTHRPPPQKYSLNFTDTRPPDPTPTATTTPTATPESPAPVVTYRIPTLPSTSLERIRTIRPKTDEKDLTRTPFTFSAVTELHRLNLDAFRDLYERVAPDPSIAGIRIANYYCNSPCRGGTIQTSYYLVDRRYAKLPNIYAYGFHTFVAADDWSHVIESHVTATLPGLISLGELREQVVEWVRGLLEGD